MNIQNHLERKLNNSNLQETSTLSKVNKANSFFPTYLGKSIKSCGFQTGFLNTNFFIKSQHKNIIEKPNTSFYTQIDDLIVSEICMGEPVYLNIYNIGKFNCFFTFCGIGFYHTSILVHKTEYCFGYTQTKGKSGIGEGETNNNLFVFKERILLGFTLLSKKLIEEIFNLQSINWESNSYNPFKKNCNDFSFHLAKMLLKNVNFPSYINRFTSILNCLDCFYIPIKRVCEKLTKKNEKEPDYIIDFNKDNSSNNLISKQKINSIFMNLSKEYSDVCWDIEKEKQIIIKEVQEIINLKLIDIFHLLDFTNNLDSIVLVITGNKKIIPENSLTHKHLNILLKNIFNSLEFFLTVCRQFLSLNEYKKSMLLLYLVDDNLNFMTKLLYHNNQKYQGILHNFHYFQKSIKLKISEIYLSLSTLPQIDDLKREMNRDDTEILKLEINR